ncbi:S8 family peptidase [Paenibacillus illinoisensis]|uniref:S8 family peptidase n=1 Tax=Paenibacillus illinoisensis TaxID=59845 RepID=UPI001C8E577C|nr:S8 family peptidase [Paenibacillus illinoisensis]MBY0216919.1 S8 family peptidase [Paenibacillus illinoisensis]
MAMTGEFSHLSLPMVIYGKPKLRGGGEKDPRTLENRKNRVSHGGYIKSKASQLSKFWNEKREERVREQLPEIKTGIPILLEIDPNSDVNFLKGLGFEVVSELENGYVIVSNGDFNFATLFRKTEDFINEVSNRCNTPARVYAFHEDESRFEKIFGSNLLSIWRTIDENDRYEVDVSISCSGNIFELEQPPTKPVDVSEEEFKKSRRFLNWQQKYYDAYDIWDELKSTREQQFGEFISHYNGEFISSFIDGEPVFLEFCDSFSVRVRISGKCLRDLVYNFSAIFAIEYVGNLCIGKSTEASIANLNFDVTIVPPDDDAPIIAVIDSGIQEGHKYLEPAILSHDSKCYVKGTTSVSDEVSNGGHGTRVAGAILYPFEIPQSGTYKLPCYIRNARVLDENNEYAIQSSVFPPLFIKAIVDEFARKAERKTKIFNHSIAETNSCEIKHMSPWATEIDVQSYENDLLFIQAAGNLHIDTIKDFYNEMIPYPTYLFDERSRIANPAQSMQALTVGSISNSSLETEDMVVIGRKNEPSAFSRSGSGIWNSVKPDVVEYGGTWAKNKNGDELRFTTPSEVCPDLIRVSPEGVAFSKDAIGTSFSTPKVAYIAAEIQKLYPSSPALLYRALIAQSARWPEEVAENSSSLQDVVRYIGYGLPDIMRATKNDEYRVTLITEEPLYLQEGQAHIFRVPIPEEMNAIGEDFDIRIEITLSYAAKPRSTRRKISRYLSTWLDWRCSKIGEDIDSFAERILVTGSAVDDDGNFDWTIGEQSNHGQAKDFSRSYSTLQKDWTIVKSNQLTDSFCIAVRGHKGWDANIPAKYSLVVSFEAINQDIAIYELIRNLVEIEIDNLEHEVEVELEEEIKE